MLRRLLLATLLAAAGCGGDGDPDGPDDAATPDAAVDASLDGPVDAGRADGAAEDGSIDAGAPADGGAPDAAGDAGGPAEREGLWLSEEEVAALPMSGEAWERLASTATGDWGSADVSDQDNDHDVCTLAGALYAVRTGDADVRAAVEDALEAAVGTEAGGRTLALGRNLLSYVIAADLISYRSARFVDWVDAVRTRDLDGRAGIRTLLGSATMDPSNWGCHARASTIAAARYLGDDAQLEMLAERFHDYVGRSGDGFDFRERWWQADADAPVGINPVGATKEGHPIDGVIPDDQRRAGEFTWPPPKENYVWESLQGTTVAAQLLHRAGWNAWHWQSQAIRRAVQWLHEQASYPAEGDDRWIPWLVNHAYGTSFPTSSARSGKNMGFTDWTHR